MKKINVAVSGASGRMGQELLQILKKSKELIPRVAFSRSQNIEGFERTYAHVNAMIRGDVDVWVDFSSPQHLMEILLKAQELQVPLISGTTGMTEAQFQKLKELGKYVPVLWSPNMSLGATVLKKTIQTLQHISEAEFLVEEAHHKNKKDKPSGTALWLQKELQATVNAKSVLDPISIRAADIVGTHRIWTFMEGETLCFTHVAQQRSIFAKGALWACKKMLTQKVGFYQLEDLL